MQKAGIHAKAVQRMKKMAIYGLRKAFVTPAKKPVYVNPRMSGFFGGGRTANSQRLPE